MRISSAIAIAAILIVGTQASAGPQQRGSAPAGQPRATPPPPPSDGSTLPAANVEHGRYLAERVAMCVECHSGRDAQGRIIDSEKYLGGVIPSAPSWAIEWAARAPRNRGLLGYDDKTALRLLTEGAIGRDGRQLQPPMPRFRMTPQDAADVIAFLRSLH